MWTIQGYFSTYHAHVFYLFSGKTGDYRLQPHAMMVFLGFHRDAKSINIVQHGFRPHVGKATETSRVWLQAKAKKII